MGEQRGKCNGRTVVFWVPEPPIEAKDLEKYGPPVTMSEISKAWHARNKERKLARKRG